jgi:hypothetical protein
MKIGDLVSFLGAASAIKIGELPTEIKFHITSCLDTKELIRLRKVSEDWYNVTNVRLYR